MSRPAPGILRVISLLCRVVAVVLSIVVVGLCFVSGSARAAVLVFLTRVSEVLPASPSAALVVETPFGGTFRGDLALVSVVLFIVDWALCRTAARS